MILWVEQQAEGKRELALSFALANECQSFWYESFVLIKSGSNYVSFKQLCVLAIRRFELNNYKKGSSQKKLCCLYQKWEI